MDSFLHSEANIEDSSEEYDSKPNVFMASRSPFEGKG